MYFDSCLSFSRYCCSSDWLELAGLITEFGFPGKKQRVHVTGMTKNTAEQHSHSSEGRSETWHSKSVSSCQISKSTTGCPPQFKCSSNSLDFV